MNETFIRDQQLEWDVTTFIRGQLEFEWLITRPYSRRWMSKLGNPDDENEAQQNGTKLGNPDDENEAQQNGTSNSGAKSPSGNELMRITPGGANAGAGGGGGGGPDPRQSPASHRKMSVLELQPLVLGGAAAKRRNTVDDVSSSVTEHDLEDAKKDMAWNASMWTSVVNAANKKDPVDIKRYEELFINRTTDFVDEYTGENLFHL